MIYELVLLFEKFIFSILSNFKIKWNKLFFPSNIMITILKLNDSKYMYIDYIYWYFIILLLFNFNVTNFNNE